SHRPRRGAVPEGLSRERRALSRQERGVRHPVRVTALPPEDDASDPAQPARHLSDRAALHGEHPDLPERAVELHVLLEHGGARPALQGGPRPRRRVPDEVLQRRHSPRGLRAPLLHGGWPPRSRAVSAAGPHRSVLYSAPRFYEIAFDMNRKQEVDFLVPCFRRYAKRPVARVLDIACGTGPHLIRLAERGYQMSGLDLSPQNVEFLGTRAIAKGLRVSIAVGDMTRFRLPRAVDAAICMQDSQGHLLDNEAIIGHLRSVSRALERGGVYVFDRYMCSSWTDPARRWSWTRRRGRATVRATFEA